VICQNTAQFLRENGRKIARISIPVLLEHSSMTLMNVVSTALATSLGSVAVSALGLVHTVNLALLLAINALAVGGTVAVARAFGRQDRDGIGKAAIQSIVSITLIGLVVTLLVWVTRVPLINWLYGEADPDVLEATHVMYRLYALSIPLWAYISIASGVLRGVGDTKTTFFVSIATSLSNLLFTYVFIRGLRLDGGFLDINYAGVGYRGPALGMLVARVIGAVAVTIPLLRSQRKEGMNAIRMGALRRFRPDRHTLSEIYRIAVPASVEQLIFEIGKIITSTIIVGLGTASLAANTIAWSVLGMFNLPGASAMTSTTTLAGQAIGEGDRSKTRSTLLVMTGLIMAIYIVLSILLLAFMKPLIGLYGAAPDVVPIVRTLLLSLLVPMTLFWPAGYIVAAGLRAAGDVKHVMLVAIVSMWTMRVGGAYFLVKVADMGILGLWISMYADWVFRVAFFGKRIVGDRWFAKSGI